VTGAIALAWSEFPAATAAQLRWAFTLRRAGLLQGKADLIAFGRPTTTVGCRGRSPASASAHAMLTDSRIIVLPKANLKDLLNKNADLFSFDLTTIAHRKPVPSIRKPVPPPVDCTLF
jgi:hypothetical protein